MALVQKTPTPSDYAGLPELSPAWVAAHQGEVTVLDVRSAEEFDGPDGRVAGSLLIPLPELENRSSEIPANCPLVVVCHSGSRSALATQQLLKAGRAQVANLRGGLSRWAAEGYPLDGVSQA
jgi:rhodanese-related sulfurtransferase